MKGYRDSILPSLKRLVTVILCEPQAWTTGGEKDWKIPSSAPPNHHFEHR